MTLKKFSRAGLIALAGAFLLAIVLSLPTFHASYAQTPTTPRRGRGGRAAAPPRRRRRPATPRRWKNARRIPATPPGC